ncbi:MAG: cytochrome c maturation protein CcmE [Magnetococcales bacterium]|nr:cytochrome c maturation protein CcmE [Magnetococcales bacterium]MBF0157667.1 cytochrome c maturation protein CcmE [Magnetococcales bacterium]
MTAKKRRALLLVTLVVVGGALLALVVTSFTGSLVYFYTPTEIAAQSAGLAGKKIRIGGMVQEGSLHKEPGSLKIRFLVTDGTTQLPVRYEGMVPDLFREGQGVVVEGVWPTEGDFPAGTILAKHSEDYVPIEMSQEGIAKSKQSLMKSLQ